MPASAVRRVDRDLLEVPVPVEVEHVGEPDDGAVVVDRHEQDAGLGGPLLPRRRGRPVDPAEPLGEQGVTGILDAGQEREVLGRARRSGRHPRQYARGHPTQGWPSAAGPRIITDVGTDGVPLARKVGAMAHTYGISEVVGTSTTSIDEAISSAVARASTTVRGLDWFEVTEIRGHLEDGVIAHYQVGLKLGFRLEE